MGTYIAMFDMCPKSFVSCICPTRVRHGYVRPIGVFELLSTQVPRVEEEKYVHELAYIYRSIIIIIATCLPKTTE